MPAKEPRYCVAQVPEESRDAWRAFCEGINVDRSAFCEAIGVWLTENAGHPLVEQWLMDARAIMTSRSRRG